MSTSRWALAVALVLALGCAAAVARWWAGQEAVRILAERDITWHTREDSFSAIELTGIAGPGLSARAVQVSLLPTPYVVVEAPVVDLDVLRANARATGTAQATRSTRRSTDRLLPTVEVRNLEVRWGEDAIVEGWRGTLLPQVQLSGPGGQVERTLTGGWSGSLRHPLNVGPLSGTATVTAECATDCTIHIDMPEAVIEHPMVAAAPLPPAPFKAALDWSDGAIDGTLQLGELQVAVQGTIQVEPTRAANLTIELPDTPLEAVVGLFGDLIPEARRARMVGTVGATGTWSWPDQTWSLVPRMDGLGVEDVLTDLDGLRSGTISWAVLDPSGVPRVRRTGPSVAGFVPFQAAGLFPAAVLAAEDSGFSRHNGVDLVAIQAALDDAREHGTSGMRGGSTITQQVAKNLFLETRERTLVRKLRELLYALELDRVVPKQRILELYINVVELGEDLYGVGPAASAYFLKRPARLTANEVAFLAALLPAPRSRGQRAWQGGRPPRARMNVILDNMRDLGRISPVEAAEAKRTTLRLVPPPKSP